MVQSFAESREAMRQYRGFAVPFVVLALTSASYAQQVADKSFSPPIEKPAFAKGAGPVVLIDEAHYNFHTASGRYLPFAELLRRDGYVVRSSSAKFDAESLKRGRVLVISNALNKKNRDDWSPPNPSAFTPAEITAVRNWVNDGGSLLLIADHMPFAGAAEDLGKAFGVRFLSGYAVVPGTTGGILVFRKSDGTLRDHAITRGIGQVATFTGSSFEVDTGAAPLLVLGPNVVSMNGRDDPKPAPVAGHLQGAALEAGKGRVAVFGEAAMFSAQLAGAARQPMGMNAPEARENARFLLNLIDWLAGRL